MKHLSYPVAVFVLFLTLHANIFAQGTAFIYQGRLNSGTNPATGLYDFRFRLAADVQGNTVLGSVLTNAVPVTNGLFSASLDYGAGYFNGSNYWIEVDVKTNAADTYTTLAPLQPVTPVPYAVFAGTASNVSGTVSAAQLSGTLPLAQIPAGVVTNNDPSVTLSNVTVTGSLTLPTTANGITLLSGSSLLLYADGSYNFYSGVNAGSRPAGGAYNTGFGDQAMNVNSGTENTAVGFTALFDSQGNGNTAIGSQALSGDGTGDNNTAEGEMALHTSTGSFNTANGASALSGNINGNYNTASGATALENIRSGNGNTADGYGALYSGFADTNGNFNTAVGYEALYNHSLGNYNTAIGVTALNLLTTGSYNIALGSGAGITLTTESSNIDIGNPGVAGDVNVTRIGTTQTQTYIAGVMNGNGGGLTNLNASQMTGSFPASQLSGTLPVAQLPGAVVTNNDPLVIFNALFVGALTFTGTGPGALNLSSPATITSGFVTVMYFDANHNLGLGGATPQQTLSLNGGMNIDQSGLNTGSTANALTFGSNSGEGIGSVRTGGLADSYGLNFYTDFTKRLTIFANGEIGINQTNPEAQLDVVNSTLNPVGLGGTAINGTSPTGVGIIGYSSTGTGIIGASPSGIGVLAASGGNAMVIDGGAFAVGGAGTNTPTMAFIQVQTQANELLYTNNDVFNNLFGLLGDGVYAVGTTINNPICDGNPNAILLITHNANASVGVGIKFGDPIGVFYYNGHWAIYDQNTSDNTAQIPTGTAFNVLVIVPYIQPPNGVDEQAAAIQVPHVAK